MSDQVSKSRFGKWEEFHQKNLHVWRLFERFAFDAYEAGRARFSARIIGERIRWYTSIETVGCEYKVNDHFWPYYARLLVALQPRFEGWFIFKDTNFDSSLEDIKDAHREAMKMAATKEDLDWLVDIIRAAKSQERLHYIMGGIAEDKKFDAAYTRDERMMGWLRGEIKKRWREVNERFEPEAGADQVSGTEETSTVAVDYWGGTRREPQNT